MKLDLYTKSVLTVIAAALLWLCAENTVRPRIVSAADVQKVVITGVEGSTTVIPVRLIGGANYDLLKVDSDNPLPVKMP